MELAANACTHLQPSTCSLVEHVLQADLRGRGFSNALGFVFLPLLVARRGFGEWNVGVGNVVAMSGTL